METNTAEIASGSEGAKVDSEATTDTTEGSAPSGSEAAAAKSEDASADKSGSSENQRSKGDERFDKLTRDLYELRGELDRGRYDREARDTRIKELEGELAKHRQVAPDNPPTLESVGYDEAKYQAAIAGYLTKQIRGSILEEVRGEIGKGEQARADREIQQTWAKREADFIKSNPDYVDKVKNDRTLPISAVFGAEIMRSEMGPQIAVYLADNREKAEAIAKLPPNLQLREFGRIEGLLEAKKAAPKPPVSQAPPPPSKVAADDAATHARVDTADSDKLSDAEWARRRNAQEAGRRRKAAS